MPCEDSTALLQQALSGDRDAWDALFTHLWPVVVGTISPKSTMPAGSLSVEDLAQNVFIRLLEDNARRLRLFSPSKGALESYVAKIAHNSWIDHIQRHSRTIRNIDIADLPEPIDEDAPSLPMAEDWEISAALETLTTRERQVIELIYKESFETVDAAKRLGVSPDTIRSEKRYALQKLKKFFGRQ